MVTLKDIARECSVSLATVSKAMNGQSDIGEKTATMVRKMAKQLGYMPNAAARSLKTNHSRNIGVLFVEKTSSGLNHEYFSEILNSVKVEAERRGYDITFITKGLGTQFMSYYEHAKYRNCDGVVIASVDFKAPDVVKLAQSDIPTVTLDHVFNSSSAVLSDNVHGMDILVQYVYNMGHRYVGIIHGEDTAVTKKRLGSFWRTCNKLKIEVNAQCVKETLYHDAKGTEKAMQEILEIKNHPTCIFMPDDFAALGALNAVEKKGLKIPEDISIVGYDGILLSQVLRPKMTTYKQDAEAMGRIAATELIEQIENPKLFIPRQIMVSGNIIPGGTVKDITRNAVKDITRGENKNE